MRAVILLLSLALPALCLFVTSAELNCNQGCPDNALEVCGEDGLTYQNRCLASCQGVEVVQQGRCGTTPQQLSFQSVASFMEVPGSRSGSSSYRFDASSRDGRQVPVISLQDMQKYSQLGYSLVGRGQAGAFQPQAPSVQQQQQQQRPGVRRETAAEPVDRRSPQAATAAVRYSSSGYTYQHRFAAVGQASKAAGTAQPRATAFDPQLQPGGSIAGFMPGAGQFGRAAFEASAEAAARLSGSAAATGEAAGMGSSVPEMGPGSEDPQSQSAETDVLVQYMKGDVAAAGGRRLLAALQQPRHTYHHHYHEQQLLPQPPPLPLQQDPEQDLHQLQQQEENFWRSLKYVIGTDDRREVSGKANKWPFSTVGQFLYRKGSCSGVMIGPGSVLTAAHCVYSRDMRMWQKDMVFVPHRHRQGGKLLEPYGRVGVETATTYSGWVDNPDSIDAIQYDIAVVRLADSTIGYKTGWLGLAWDKKPFRGKVFTTGYPGDKARGSMWFSACNVTDYGGSDTRFLNNCDSWNGQSGSPMWEKRGKDSYFLRAVLSYEACNCCTPDCRCCVEHTNGGCKITYRHYRNILKWRQ